MMLTSDKPPYCTCIQTTKVLLFIVVCKFFDTFASLFIVFKIHLVFLGEFQLTLVERITIL